MNSGVNDLLDSSIDKVKSLIDPSIVIGKAVTYNSVMIIPISKVKCSVLCGGIDQVRKENDSKNPFGGGVGSIINLTPLGVLVIQDGKTNLLLLEEKSHILENLIDLIPDVTSKMTSLIKKDNANKD